MERRNAGYGNDVNVQENEQVCDNLGNDNSCKQRLIQKSEVRRSNRNNRNSGDE
jgi:hypothetical protein